MQTQPVFIDSSAFYALIDRSDSHHDPAKSMWPCLLEDHIKMVTTSYVAIETANLLQEHLGFEAAELWQRSMLCVVEVIWIDPSIYRHGVLLWMNLGRYHCSLVDCISFATINNSMIAKVFSFKPCFVDQGYNVVPNKSGMNENNVNNLFFE